MEPTEPQPSHPEKPSVYALGQWIENPMRDGITAADILINTDTPLLGTLAFQATLDLDIYNRSSIYTPSHPESGLQLAIHSTPSGEMEVTRSSGEGTVEEAYENCLGLTLWAADNAHLQEVPSEEEGFTTEVKTALRRLVCQVQIPVTRVVPEEAGLEEVKDVTVTANFEGRGELGFGNVEDDFFSYKSFYPTDLPPILAAQALGYLGFTPEDLKVLRYRFLLNEQKPTPSEHEEDFFNTLSLGFNKDELDPSQ